LATRSYKEENLGNRIQLIVGNQFCKGFEHGSRGTPIFKIRYQETSREKPAEEYPLLEAVTTKLTVAGWRRLSV
jgi:hypothetical protein